MKPVALAFVLMALVGYGAVTLAGRPQAAKRVIAPENGVPPVVDTSPLVTIVKPHTVLKTSAYLEQVIGSVWYDYFWNSGGPRHAVWHNDGTTSRTYLIYITRTPPSATGVREINYVSYDGTNFSTPQAPIPGTTQWTYFSGIDVWRGGSADARAGIGVGWAGSGISYYCLEGSPGAGGFTITQMTDSRDVQVTNLDNAGTVLCNHSKGRTDYAFRVSTDFGLTWADANQSLLALATGGQTLGALEPPIVSRNGNAYLFTDLSGAGDAQVPPIGTAAPDSASIFCIFKSTDRGMTWTMNKLFTDGIQYDARHFALFSNIEQFDLAVDASEKAHIVLNGYNFYQYDASSTDSLRESIDVVYWDATHGFKSLVSFDRTLQILPDVIAKRGPRGTVGLNRLGCSYPSIATSDDGQKIVCTWSQPNFTATTIETNASGWVTSNIWYNTSYDGGANWLGARKLTASTGKIEEFSNLAENLEVTPYDHRGQRVIFLRVSTGTIGDGTDAEEAVYVEWGDGAIGVNNNETNSMLFGLEQNFPNPFNPATSIAYTVGGVGLQASGFRDVRLVVYDLLGQEVAVLVNERKMPGSYEVKFDGSNLSSGVYLCRLTAGSFVETKKLLLLR
jgi:hypothetical protein